MNGYNPFFSPAFCKSPFVPNPIQSENGAADIQIPTIPAKYEHVAANIENYSVKGQPYDGFVQGEDAPKMPTKSAKRGSKSRPENYCCSLCKETFPNNRQLEQHTKMAHSVKHRHHCDFPMCTKSFTRKDVLARHINAKHTQIKTFVCTKCGEIFYYRHHLTYHLARKHDEGTSYVCKICNETFPKKQALQYHMNSLKHSSEKHFQCPIPSCLKKFTRGDALNRHINDKHTSQC